MNTSPKINTCEHLIQMLCYVSPHLCLSLSPPIYLSIYLPTYNLTGKQQFI